MDGHPPAGAGGFQDGVADDRAAITVLERGADGRDRAAGGDRLQEMTQLVDHRRVPADSVARRPPGAAPRMIRLGHVDLPQATTRRRLVDPVHPEAVQALEVEEERAAGAVPT